MAIGPITNNYELVYYQYVDQIVRSRHKDSEGERELPIVIYNMRRTYYVVSG